MFEDREAFCAAMEEAGISVGGLAPRLMQQCAWDLSEIRFTYYEKLKVGAHTDFVLVATDALGRAFARREGLVSDTQRSVGAPEAALITEVKRRLVELEKIIDTLRVPTRPPG